VTAPARIKVIGWQSEVPGWHLPDSDEPRWWDLALCAETDPELFFPEKGGGSRAAKQICRKCDVRAECLEDALANDERFGVRGGLSVSERDRIVKQQAASAFAPAVPQPCHAGHLRTPDNLYLDGSCRTCKIDRAREKREAAAIAREDAMRRYIEQEMSAA
jgi:WhiB family redox-sensing transcriptional regulator